MEAVCRRALHAVVGGAVLCLLLGPPAAAAAGGDPPGNNGTVKIDGLPFDDVPDNEAHPGCVFEVDFYGFDEGDLLAHVTFEAVEPTSGGELMTDDVPIGEDSHAGGGSERGLDASRSYDLAHALDGIEPHRNQGWHVRLTVHADGSQGADVKYKVFWVDGCEATVNAPVAIGSEATIESGTVGAAAVGPGDVASTDVPSSAGQVLAAELVATPQSVAMPVAPAPAEVLGESVTRAPAGSAAPSVLARTGIGLGLATVATTLIMGGVVLVRGARRRAFHVRT